jgi:hypothetical protein
MPHPRRLGQCFENLPFQDRQHKYPQAKGTSPDESGWTEIMSNGYAISDGARKFKLATMIKSYSSWRVGSCASNLILKAYQESSPDWKKYSQ